MRFYNTRGSCGPHPRSMSLFVQDYPSSPSLVSHSGGAENQVSLQLSVRRGWCCLHGMWHRPQVLAEAVCFQQWFWTFLQAMLHPVLNVSVAAFVLRHSLFAFHHLAERKFDERSELQQRKEEGRFPSICLPNAPLEISRSCQRLLDSSGWKKLWSFLPYRSSIATWTWAQAPVQGVRTRAGSGPGRFRRPCQPQPPCETVM